MGTAASGVSSSDSIHSMRIEDEMPREASVRRLVVRLPFRASCVLSHHIRSSSDPAGCCGLARVLEYKASNRMQASQCLLAYRLFGWY